MNVALEKILDRISNYDFLNCIIPGAVYVAFAERITSFHFLSGHPFRDFILIYFCGVVLGRISSLIVEKVLKKTKVIKFAPYADFIDAEKEDKAIRNLSIINNMYRSFVSVLLCLLVTFFLTLYALFLKKRATISKLLSYVLF